MQVQDKEIKSYKLQAIIGLFLVAIIWGSTFTANKIALESLTPMSLMAVRFMIAFLTMLIIFRKKFLNINIKKCIGGILCGISLFIGFILQTYGLLYTDAGKQAFLSGVYVIVVPFLTWLVFKKQPKPKTYIGSLLCFYGISLLSLNIDMSINIGDILTILSSVFFAAQIVIAGYYIEREDAAVMATVQFGVMGVLSTLVVIVIKDMSFITVFTNIFSFSSLSVVYLGVLGTATAYYLQILCQKHTNTTTTSIILSTEAVFGALIAVLVLKDIFTIKMLFGAIVMLLSILISEIDIPLNKICNAIKSNIIKRFNSK